MTCGCDVPLFTINIVKFEPRLHFQIAAFTIRHGRSPILSELTKPYCVESANHGCLLWISTFIVPIAFALLVWRTMVEDRMLQRDLLGYADYAARVPYRLVPGVW
jgi:hypothetical protein